MAPAPRTRREFLADVARGAVLATVGPGLALQLGARLAAAEKALPRLSFGALDPLVALMQETPLDRLLAVLVERLKTGTDLKTLVAAGALANARTFGGEDYIGFHTMMALAPAWRMAEASPHDSSRALPVLKVLYRNTERIAAFGGSAAEVLHPVAGAANVAWREGLRDAVRAKDLAGAEARLAGLLRGDHRAGGPSQAALPSILAAVEDDLDVHRVVLPYRAVEMLEITGPEHAHTLLRQSLRFCLKAERSTPSEGTVAIRTWLPKVIEAHNLRAWAPEQSLPVDDAWIERTSRAIFEAETPQAAAHVAGAALAEGRSADAVGEAISLAANQLLLRDHGRSEREARPEKPVGSVHGDSIGVHASDSANAWRNLAKVPGGNVTCLVAGAYQVARDRVARGGDFLHWTPHPLPEALEKVTEKDPQALVSALDGAVREKDQARAAAVVARYLEQGHPPRAVIDVMLRHAVAEDGALHAEKYWRTAVQEFAAGRAAFRDRHLVALARVTASEFGRPAPCVEEARRLLA